MNPRGYRTLWISLIISVLAVRLSAQTTHIFISGQVLFQKLFQKKHLLSEFEVGLENALDICDVDPIDLGGVDLSLAGKDSRMQSYCG